MYERCTDRFRKVMQLANQEAQRFNHEYIGTEHLLLGLIREGSGVAANALNNLNINLKKVRKQVQNLIQSGPEMITMGKLPQTPRAKKVIESAKQHATNMKHHFIGTEHLILGLLAVDEGVAAQVLVNMGVRLEEVQQEVLNLLGTSITDPEFETEKHGTGKRLTKNEQIKRKKERTKRLRTQRSSRNSALKYPSASLAMKQMTRPLDHFADSESDSIDVDDETLDRIKIAIQRHASNNIYLIGSEDQVQIYVEALIRSDIGLQFLDFAESKFPHGTSPLKLTNLFDAAFNSSGLALVFHNFHQLFQIGLESSSIPFGDQMESWLKFPNVRLIASGDQGQKQMVIDDRPNIGRHFSCFELPPLTRIQIEKLVARNILELERFHLCSFAEDAVALVIDEYLKKNKLPIDCYEITSRLDHAAARMRHNYVEENISAAHLDRQIKIRMEKYASAVASGDLPNIKTESRIINDLFEERKGIAGLPVIGIQQINDVK